jgi:hypothetical protein
MLADAGPLGSSGLQYGALGLLGFVIVVGIPTAAKIVLSLLASKDKMIDGLLADRKADGEKVLAAFTETAVTQAKSADAIRQVMDYLAVVKDRERRDTGRASGR